MCARRHAADDRDRPEGLADALARWDTAQSWMKPTPRPEDTGRPEEPADAESGALERSRRAAALLPTVVGAVVLAAADGWLPRLAAVRR